MSSGDIDTIVVGAGVAGLAAAASLRRQGRSVRILEGGHRIGGRAWTERPASLGGAMFDHGAQWLHNAEHNPLVGLVRAQGEHVGPDIPWEDRLVLSDVMGTDNAGSSQIKRDQVENHRAYAAAEARWRTAVTAELAGPDMSLADAAYAVADDPWTATIEFWEGAIIAAADADLLSLRDWAANELDGSNFISAGGLGDLLARCLGPLAGPVEFGAKVHAIEPEGQGVRVSSSRGDLHAGRVVVTVSTGVLGAGGIRFLPGLPDATLAAIEGLPMGLLTKIALLASGPDRFGLSPGSNLFQPLSRRGAPAISTMLWPQNAPIATGFIGGRLAWQFAGTPRLAIEFMLDDLRSQLGNDAASSFHPDGLMTKWGTDPLFLGAYAYAPPGHAGARLELGRPVWDGRLVFAGEACAPAGFAGTVAGAFMSGEAAVS